MVISSNCLLRTVRKINVEEYHHPCFLQNLKLLMGRILLVYTKIPLQALGV